MCFKAGDVVLGSFATEDGSILKHYSVVLTGNEDGAMLVYTTSLKERSAAPQVFTAEDMKLANWTTSCRWDASTVSLVPNTEIRKVGRITSKTLAAITVAYANASKQRTVRAMMLNSDNTVVSL
jgi:hypothetical protein